MRKSLFLSLALGGLFFGAFSFHSCQKETIEKRKAVSEQKQPASSSQTKTCYKPDNIRNRQVDVACVQGYACDRFPLIPQRNQNRIRWQITDCINVPYPENASYALYKKTGTATGGTPAYYTRVAAFQCNKSDMWYASPVLTNNSDFVLFVDHPDVASFPTTMEEHLYTGGFYDYYSGGVSVNHNDAWRFSTGSTAGSVSCIVVGPREDL